MEKDPRNVDALHVEELKNDSLAKYMEQDKVFPDMTSTVSAQECTGLFPRKPENAEEYENLQEMYGMEIPKKKDAERETR